MQETADIANMFIPKSTISTENLKLSTPNHHYLNKY